MIYFQLWSERLLCNKLLPADVFCDIETTKMMLDLTPTETWTQYIQLQEYDISSWRALLYCTIGAKGQEQINN